MFRVKLNGIEIECDSVSDVSAVIAALQQRRGGVISAPEPRTARKPAAPAHAVPTGKRRGRVPAIDEKLARKLHVLYLAGASLMELARDNGLGSGGSLWARFKALGLPTGTKAKAAAAATVPVKRLAPGQSGIRDEKGRAL